MSTLIGALRVSLGLDSAAFVSGSKRAASEVDVLGSRMEKAGFRVGQLTRTLVAGGAIIAGSALVANLKNLAERGLEYASSLGEVSQQLGVTTSDLQFFRYAASQNGIAQEEMDKGLQKLTRTIGAAANGNKAAQKAFADLGIDIKDANGKLRDAGDLLPEIGGAFVKLDGPARQGAAAFSLFGKSGQALVPLLTQGKTGIDGLRDAYRRLGIELSPDQIAKADDAADKLAALKMVLEAKIAGAASDNVDSIMELVNALIKLVEYAGKAVRAWKDFSNSFSGRQFAGDLGTGPGGIALAVTRQITNAQRAAVAPSVQLTFSPGELAARRDATSGGVSAAPAFLRKPGSSRGTYTPGGGPTKFAAGDIAIEAGRGTAALIALQKMSQEFTAVGGRINPVLVEIANDAAEAGAAFPPMADTIRASMARLDAEMADKAIGAAGKTRQVLVDLAIDVRQIMNELFPEQAAALEQQARLARLSEAVKAKLLSTGDFEEARRRLELVTAGVDPGEEIGQSWADAVGPIVQDIGTVSAAFDKFRGAANDNANDTAAANVRIVQSFKDMADATLSALQRVSDAFSGGSFLDKVGAIVGLATQLGSIGAFGKTIQRRINAPVGTPPIAGARALGGPVLGGRAYLVGERGPELFTPGANGVITSNRNLRGMGGGGGIAEIRPSKYFDVVVDGRIVGASPSIMDGGARIAARRGARAQSRRLA